MAEPSIYSATYSNVPVYEIKVGSDSVMRRRHDDWINATHILKVAGLDKPSRTRILEREVQKGIHEKIQGGYGKYQGTWVPLSDGRILAERNAVLSILLPIFNYVPGDRTPPPAPKHGSRPKVQRTTAPTRRGGRAGSFASANKRSTQTTSFINSQETQSQTAPSLRDDESILQESRESSVSVEEEVISLPPPSSTHQRKRKRETDLNTLTLEQQHIMYGDALLDYFMTVGDAPAGRNIQAPKPPANFQPNLPIDEAGNPALHWACAMGDLDVVRDLLDLGANIFARTYQDETPLVRAVLFTNNYERRTMPDLAEILKSTIGERDFYQATVFHHLAAATKSKGKWKSSRYYCQVLITKLAETYSRNEMEALLASQDSNGDTAALTAAKNGCYRLAEILLAKCQEAGKIANKNGETADEVMMMIQKQHVSRELHRPSSATQNSFPGSDNLERHDSGQSSQLTATSEATAALLRKINSIVEDANSKLTRAYSEARLLPQNLDSKSHPKDMFEQVEQEREIIRRDQSDTLSKEAGSEALETLADRYQGAKKGYGSVLERSLENRLQKKFESLDASAETATTTAAQKEDQSNASSTSNTDGVPDHKAKDSAEAVPTVKTEETPANEWPEKLEILRNIMRAESKRQNGVLDVISHRADAGPDARRNVHRKLVALATGLPEKDLDPMAKDLASNLEFTRAHQSRPNKLVGGHAGSQPKPTAESG